MQFKGLLYYAYINIRYSLMIFWLIIGGILLLSLVSQLFLGSENTNIYFSFVGPLYAFAAIMGYWMVKNMVPYVVKMGSDRMNIYVVYGIVFFVLSLFNAVIANTINSLLTKLNGGTGNIVEFSVENGTETSQVQFNHPADLLAMDDWLHRVIIDTSLSFFFIAVSFIIGLVFYRFRLVGGFAFLGAIFLAFIIAASKGWVVEFALHLYHNFSFTFFYQMFGIGVVIYLLSYLLLRRVTVS